MNIPTPRAVALAAVTLVAFLASAPTAFAVIDLTTFVGPVEFGTDRDPSSLAIGDLDGDGKLDLATANYQSNTLGIYRNTSTPGGITSDTFAPAVNFYTGPNPAWVVLADLDRNGKLDVIVANDYGSSISLFPNISTVGEFNNTSLGERIDLDAGTHPVGLAVADFDGDGWEDIAVVNAVLGPSTVGIYRNLGVAGPLSAESFAPMVEFATGDYSFKVLAADFDGDSSPDLAVANITSGDVSLLRNVSTAGDIQFAEQLSVSTQARNFECAAGDLNNDGKVELIVVHDGGTSIFQNYATPGELTSDSFGAAVPLPITGTAYETEVGDLDADGDSDLVVTVLGQQGLSVFANLGTVGTITTDSFGPKLDYGVDGNSVGIADLDGDGRRDLATCHMYRISTYWNTGSVPTPPRIVSQPRSRGAMPGQTIRFRVGAIGSEPLTYQWFFNGQSIEGATGPSYVIDQVQLEDAGDYSVHVSNALGAETSEPAHLEVVPRSSLADALDTDLNWVTDGTAPWASQFSVTHDDEDAAAAGSVCCGETSNLRGTVDGPVQLSFWWAFEPSQTSYSALTFWAAEERIWLTANPGAGWQQVRLALGPGTHTLRWTFYREGFLSEPPAAWLDEVSVGPLVDDRPPLITRQPASQLRFVGGDAHFEVEASGAAPLEYQWWYNDGLIDGATDSQLTLGNLQPEQAGEYWVVVSNPYGQLESQHAVLAVRTPMPVPMILSITPESGLPLTHVVISGQNFSASPAENIVYFGAVPAEVLTASPEALEVSVPLGATFSPVTVTVNGYVAWSPQSFVPVSAGAGEITVDHFESRVEFLTQSDPSSLALGDLDGDGKADMLTINYQSSTLGIYRNASSAGSISPGSFEAPVHFPTPSNPAWIAVGDLNNDGKLDVVVANDYGANISIFENRSTPGSFNSASLGPRIDLPAGIHPVGLAIADFDGDGWSDIAVANAAWELCTVGIYQNVGAHVISSQSFTPMIEFQTGDYSFKCTAGDLDGDGKPDLAVPNILSGDVSILRNVSEPGSISFAPTVNVSTGTRNFECAIGDLDGDGKAELVVTHDDGVSIFKNQATPREFTADSLAEAIVLPTPGTAYEVELADLNGDARLDLVVSVLNQPAVSVYQNRSTAESMSGESFGPKTDLPLDGNSVGLADLDRDGRPEVVTCHHYRISIRRNIIPLATTTPEDPEPEPQAHLSAEAGTFRVSTPIYAKGKIYFTVEGAMSKTLVIETSTDLIHWTTLTVVPDAGAGIMLSESVVPSVPQRFFRARVSP